MFYVWQMYDGRWQVDAYTSAPQSARMMAARAPGFDTKEAAENARRDMVEAWASADTCAAFIAADDAWQTELNRRFGPEAYQARYEKRGRGSFDDDLGRAFLARDKARMIWERDCRGTAQ